jgi:portal protein
MTDDSKFLELARKRFRDAVEAERDIRREAEIDLQFLSGEGQWQAGVIDMKAEREASGRPALTFNKLPTYVQSVANEARQNKPQPKVNPIGGGSTTDTATVLTGIMRHIQYRSQADVAWDTALDYSAGCSFGFVRFTSEFTTKSFDQELRIDTVVDPFSVYGVLMPACRRERCTHAFVVKRISREEYTAKYGAAEDGTNFESSVWQDCEDWIDEKSIRIAEYWTAETQTKTLRLIQSDDPAGKAIYTDDPGYTESLPFVLGDNGQPQERDEEITVVSMCQIDGARVLPGTRTTWVGDSIPIVAVLGQQMIINGRVFLFSLIRHVRDPQQLLNIYKSALAERIGLGNRVPYIGAKGAFRDPRWENANNVNYAYLEYEPIMIGGALAPPPQRQPLAVEIEDLSLAAAQEVEDLKSGMGIFDASLGAKGNETAGVAIGARQRQSNVTNFHFSDNLNRAEWTLGVMLVKVIPKIYDRPGRQVRIVGEDQQHSVVVVNQKYTDEKTGKEKFYPLDVGDYDVVVTVGPSSTTARLEGAETLQQFFTAAPQTVPILGDLWVGSLDYPWAREAARRLKAAAPQQIVNDDSQDGQSPVPPQIQQQMQKLQQDAQQAHQFAQSLHEQLETKQPELTNKLALQKADLDFKREQLAVQVSMQSAQLGLQGAIAQLSQELATIKAERAMTNANQQSGADRLHEATTQQSDQAHQLGIAQQSQAAAGAAQASDQAHQAQQATQAQDATAQQAALPLAA